ncbi:MAG: DUF6597 domain-containing transcriptional factor [Chloroflexota bacterium]
MTIHFYTPASPLSQYIEALWYVDLQVPYAQEKILPTGCIELIINLGPPHMTFDQDGLSYKLMRDSWVAGFHTRYIINAPLAETRMFGVRFKPGGAAPFFDEPIHLFTNAIVDLDGIWGSDSYLLRERLLGSPSISQAFQLLDAYLLSRLFEKEQAPKSIVHAVDQLVSAQGRRPIRGLSAEVGYSQKHLIKKFKDTVGVTPKQFNRVLKLQAVLKQIDSQRPINWSTVAQDAFYYDQSHFNRDFRSFAGLTPEDYVKQRLAFFESSELSAENAHFVPLR